MRELLKSRFRESIREYCYSMAESDGLRLLDNCPQHAVPIAIELFAQRIMGAPVGKLPPPFCQKLEQALTNRLTYQVYSQALDAILQAQELIEAILQRAARGALIDATKRAWDALANIDPHLRTLLLSRLVELIDCPTDEKEQIRPIGHAPAAEEVRQFVADNRDNAFAHALKLFCVTEGCIRDLPRVVRQKLEEALRDRLIGAHPRAAEVVAQTHAYLESLVEQPAVDAFDEAFESFRIIEDG